MMEHINAFIFDLGGVLLNIDYARTDQAFRALGIEHFGELYSQQRAGLLFSDLETGRIGIPAFLDTLKKESDQNLNDQQLIDAWNAMLLDFPEERIDFLREIGAKYPIYLLSNTNAIHLEAFNRILKSLHGMDSLDLLFKKPYYSHVIGARKPDPESYNRVLRENSLDPRTTLFIDDTSPNIEGAKRVGLQTLLLTPPKTILDLNTFLE